MQVALKEKLLASSELRLRIRNARLECAELQGHVTEKRLDAKELRVSKITKETALINCRADNLETRAEVIDRIRTASETRNALIEARNSILQISAAVSRIESSRELCSGDE